MVDCCDLFLNAVVKQTAEDYRVALVREHIGYKEKDNDMEIRNIERFFKSKEFNSFTKLDGVELMNAIKAEVIKFNYDLDALYDSHGSRKSNVV